ncbi:hypothetical protein EVAR_69562_1 [Eumeta japonica]|uniref:Uncharacterized protein n=1 Tax=Eumeta variegata TaxID=151549 RepID=A0A4C1SY46_EUMVA|nr:hypothetical protein EVAR_69562_1 [Eumeta japonica]
MRRVITDVNRRPVPLVQILRVIIQCIKVVAVPKRKFAFGFHQPYCWSRESTIFISHLRRFTNYSGDTASVVDEHFQGSQFQQQGK